MPLLGTLLITMINALISVFGRFMVLKIAYRLAFVTTMVALASGLYLALHSCSSGVCGAAISGISSSHPKFAVGLGIAFNSTTYAAVSCYISVWTLCQMYVFKKRGFGILTGD